jgi:hypothetical protein
MSSAAGRGGLEGQHRPGPGDGRERLGEALEIALPELAAAFKPEIIVSQHGADAHAWDPLAHLKVTTTAMGRAAHLVDGLAHLHAGGRGWRRAAAGYDVYRVVPRDWAHVWLAQAHQSILGDLSPEWRARWAADAEHYGQSPIPTTLDDEPNAGEPRGPMDDPPGPAGSRSGTGRRRRRRAAPRPSVARRAGPHMVNAVGAMAGAR